MKQVMFRLTEDEFTRANLNSISKGFKSINEFAKFSVLNFETTLSSVEVKNETVKQFSVYLYPHEIEMLERNAKLHGMSLSREMAIRLRQSCLKNEVCLYPDEMLELRKLKTEVNSIGRNIHYIISGERFCTINDPDLMNEVRELILKCNEIKKTFELLIDGAANRFG